MTALELLDQLRELNFTISADDGRLIVRGPKEGLPPELRARLTERKSEILELLKDSAMPRRTPLRRVPRDRELCLSFAQQRLWFLDQLEPGKSIYNVPGALRLKGPLDVDALQRSLEEIVRRHEALRTTFATGESGPVQIVSPSSRLTLLREEIRCGREEEAEAEISHRVVLEGSQPFDLSRGPLLRAKLIRVGADDHVLLLTMHHIVSDGWSMGILYRELSALYRAFLRGEPSPVAELPIQYVDFAVWQREWLKGPELDRQLAYWKKQLDGIPALLNLPTDRPRPAIQSFRGRTQSRVFGKDLVEGLKALNRREGVTLFMTLLAAFQTLLHRYSGQEDIVVGAAIANRNRTEIEGLIGFFVNALALRANCSGDPTFRDFLASVRRTALDAYEHQDLPFEKLVEELNPHRTLSYTPVFQVMFVLQNAPDSAMNLEDLSVSRVRGGGETAKFDLTLSVSETAQGLRVSLQYNTDLFEDATIARWLGHYETLLEAIVKEPDRSLSEFSFLRQEEREQLLLDWNKTATEYPRDACVHELFEAQVQRTPDKTALICGEEQLTYAELNQHANQLAHHILKEAGVRPGDLVGVCLERGLELIIALLGILKVGGAYLPLDPGYPKERLAFMLQDAGTNVVLTDEDSRGSLPRATARVICLDSEWKRIAQAPSVNPNVRCAADDLAYVIYTSGSTGIPKGVEVRHRGVARLLFGVNYAQLDATQTLLHLAPISFDAATFEVWGALLHNGTCVLFPGRVPNPAELEAVLKKYHITTLWLTAALFNTVIDQEPQALSDVRQLLIGGEALSAPHVRKALQLLPNTKIINGYGPTESTTFTCCYPIPRTLGENVTSIPIGRPIANTEVYIFDTHLNPVPIGVAGELYIGGDGLARGYLNRPELTEEKFIANPVSNQSGARLYKTGDQARFLADGNIEFLGRLDGQVKIRGYRIELGEIEWVLGQHPQVREAIVLAPEEGGPGQKCLVGYVVCKEPETLSSNHLREYLKTKLPDYMIPSAFVIIDKLPMTPNGKVDRAILRGMVGQGQEIPDQVTPRTSIEVQVAQIWAEVLNVSRVGMYDNFFDSGGHSLLAIRLLACLTKELKIELPLGRFLENPTVAHMAEYAELAARREEQSSNSERRWSYLFKLKGGDGGNPVFVFPGGFGGENEALVLAQLAHFVGREYPFYGLRARSSVGVLRGHKSVEEMASDFVREIRQLQPHGPYYLVGHCLGGVVAYEAACQLECQEEEVDLLAFLDTVRPTFLRYLRFRAWRMIEKMIPNWKFYYRDRMLHHWSHLNRLHWREGINYLTKRLGTNTVREMFDLPPATQADLSPPRLRQLRDNQSGHIATLLRYRAPRYRGQVHSLVADELLKQKKDSTLGWGKCVAGGIVVHRGSGDHDSFLRDYTENVGAVLRTWIEKSRTERINPEAATNRLSGSGAGGGT